MADLGPGPLTITPSSPFFLSNQAWMALQNYVSAALNPRLYTAFQQGQILDPTSRNVVDQMIAHCLGWQQSGFPTVIALAGDLASWAGQVPSTYGSLKTSLTANPAAAAQVLGGLSSSASTLSQNASSGLQIVQAFVTECQQDYQAYQQIAGTLQADLITDQAQLHHERHNIGFVMTFMSLWQAVQVQLPQLMQMLAASNGPIQTLQLLEGVWTTLVQDLQAISSEIATSPPTDAFVAALDLDTAIAEWTAVGNAATAFVASAPAVGAGV